LLFFWWLFMVVVVVVAACLLALRVFKGVAFHRARHPNSDLHHPTTPAQINQIVMRENNPNYPCTCWQAGISLLASIDLVLWATGGPARSVGMCTQRASNLYVGFLIRRGAVMMVASLEDIDISW
jgi:hypothetical protein